MKQNFQRALSDLLAPDREGGFSDHPDDPGGMTNLGVTKAVWESWMGRPVTEQEMRNLKPSDVASLYRTRYWDAVRADDLPSGVDYAVFDAAVNSGVRRASRWLQQAARVTDDGQIGPQTIRAVKALPPQQVIARFTDTRRAFLESLPTWGVFGRGWSRRVAEVAVSAKAMSGDTSNLA